MPRRAISVKPYFVPESAEHDVTLTSFPVNLYDTYDFFPSDIGCKSVAAEGSFMVIRSVV